MAKLKQSDLNDICAGLESRTPEELICWASSVFGDRVAALSAMQRAGSVICHMVGSLKLDIPVVFVDTGVNFQETLETRDRIQQRYGLNVMTLTPAESMEDQTKRLGVLYLTPEGQKQCCDLRKSQPLLTIRGKFDCLIGSLRRADGGARGFVPVLAIDPEMNALRLNPLANMNDDQFDDFIERNNVIVNPLHFQGFSTIGCNRCTTPVLPNEPKRAGRWRHLGSWSVYCGINPTDRDGGASKSIDVPDALIDRILGRQSDFSI